MDILDSAIIPDTLIPFAIDHALLIASKVCAALEHVHARRSDAGAKAFHGLITPKTVLVSFEGEVRIKGFGYWPSRVREAGLLLEPEELQTWRLLHAAPQPYTRERWEDTYNWTVKWNMTLAGATYENTVDNRAWA